MWETEMAVFIIGLVFIIAITIRYAGIVAREREAKKHKKRGDRNGKENDSNKRK
jgi:hypothetical protein